MKRWPQVQPTVFCICQMISRDARECPLHKHLFPVKP